MKLHVLKKDFIKKNYFIHVNIYMYANIALFFYLIIKRQVWTYFFYLYNYHFLDHLPVRKKKRNDELKLKKKRTYSLFLFEERIQLK